MTRYKFSSRLRQRESPHKYLLAATCQNHQLHNHIQLYSGQIADSFVNGIFNPNNLGYDISLVYSPFELDNDPSSHWNYLFNDAPFDRNKDFRERKAEVNFVDGGMEI